MRYHIALASVIVSVGLFAVVPHAHAALTEAQVQSVQQLLVSFGVESQTIRSVIATLRTANTEVVSGDSGCTGSNVFSTITGRRCPSPAASGSGSCPSLSFDMSVGSTDLRTNGEVSALQRFLGGQVTGYFGLATKALVQQWQQARGITASGYVGSETRAAIKSCAAPVSSSTRTTRESSMNACVVYQPNCGEGYVLQDNGVDANGCTRMGTCVPERVACTVYQPNCGPGYTLRSNGTDANGCTRMGTCVPLPADLSAEQGGYRLEILFTASGLSSGTTYTLEFGDGISTSETASGSTLQASHTYRSAGTYQAILRSSSGEVVASASATVREQ